MKTNRKGLMEGRKKWKNGKMEIMRCDMGLCLAYIFIAIIEGSSQEEAVGIISFSGKSRKYKEFHGHQYLEIPPFQRLPRH